MRFPVPAFLLLSLTVSLTAQPLRFGDPFPLPNTRYGSAPGAVKLVSTGDALYAFWSTGAQVRMAKVVDGERRGGVAVLSLRPEPSLPSYYVPRSENFDVVWTGAHFVVAGGTEAAGRRSIVTTAVTRLAEPFSPVVTVAGDGYDPVMASNGHTVLLLYTTLMPSSEYNIMALPLSAHGRRTSLEAYQVGLGTAKAVASNGTSYAGLMPSPGNIQDIRVMTFDGEGRTERSQILHRSEAASLAIAGDGENYLAVISDVLELSAFRVSPGGTLLSSKLVVDQREPDLTRRGIITPSATWSGSEWVVVYSDTRIPPTTLHAATVDREATTVLRRESIKGTSTGSTAAFNGTAVTAWWPLAFTGLAAPLYSALPLAANTPRELTFKAAEQILLATASSNNAVLTVWQETADGMTSLRAGIRTQTGEWRERLLVEGQPEQVHAASDGTSFAVFAKVSTRAGAMPIFLEKVYLLDERAAVTANKDLPFWPEAVASNGKSYAFVSDSSAALVMPSGTITTPATVNASNLFWPSMASDGENFLIAWASDPICGIFTGPCFGAQGLRAARFGPDLQRLDAEDFVLVTGREIDRPRAAFNGQDYVIVWTDAQSGLTASILPKTGDIPLTRVLTKRTDLPVMDMIGTGDGVMLVVTDRSIATHYRTGLLFLDRLGTLTQRNTFNHSTSVTSRPHLGLLGDGRLAYSISQFVEEAPQHGSSHVLLMLESLTPRPGAPQLTASTDERMVRLNWTAAVGTVNGYRVEYRLGDGSWNELDRWFGPNERTATFRLNRTGERASFRVRAWSDGGTGAYSDPATVNVLRRRAVR